MRRMLPVLLILLGLGGGVGAGWFLKPPAPEPEAAEGSRGAPRDGADDATAVPDPDAGHDGHGEAAAEERSYVTVGRQTIVPVVEGARTRALMLFELAVDVDPSAHDRAVFMEPRLRDAFLRELLKMSSTGAFTETFTEEWIIDELRRNLSAAARRYLGDAVREVLVLDVVRQEL